MNLANRLNRLEKRLGPPPQQPSLLVIKLARALTQAEVELLARSVTEGDSFEDTPEIRDIHRRVAAIVEETARELKAKGIASEL